MECGEAARPPPMAAAAESAECRCDGRNGDGKSPPPPPPLNEAPAPDPAAVAAARDEALLASANVKGEACGISKGGLGLPRLPGGGSGLSMEGTPALPNAAEGGAIQGEADPEARCVWGVAEAIVRGIGWAVLSPPDDDTA